MSGRSIYSAIILLGVALLGTQTALAANLKIGVVSMPKLLSEAPQAKAASKRLQKEFEPQQQKLLSQQQQLKKLSDKLDKNGIAMSGTEKQDTESRLHDLQRSYNRKQSDYLDDLNEQRNEELGKLQRVLTKEVQDYAKREHYDLIIGDGVFYASNAIDITDRILERLRKDYGSGSQ